MKKSSLKEVVVALNVITALAIMLLVSVLNEQAREMTVLMSLLILTIGVAAFVVNIVYLATRSSRPLVKIALILIDVLVAVFILIAVGALFGAR